MNLAQLLYGHRDPQASIRRAKVVVEAEFARIDERASRLRLEESDALYGIHSSNGRGLGDRLKTRRHWPSR